MIDEATIAKAVELLQKAAPPKAKVFLFGSYARGNANEKSDLDLLVVEPQLGSRREETARLKGALKPLGIPADVIVVSGKTYRAWTRVHQAIKELPGRAGRSYPAIDFGLRVWAMFGNQPPGAPQAIS